MIYSMKILLSETKTDKKKPARISEVIRKELPLKKEGWKFNWKSLFNTEGAILCKISLEESPEKIEGMIMFTLLNEEMIFMNNIEIAPHNLGREGLYKDVAGSLIAFACKVSFEMGENAYRGFLSFDSKTELIGLYQKRYGAKLAMGHKMYIDPEGGQSLMAKYLKIET